MKYIGYALLALSIFMLLGTVGGIDHNTIPLEEGFDKCIIYLVLTIVGALIVKKFEEKENEED